MKNILLTGLVCLVLLCCTGAGPCWLKYHQGLVPAYPAPVVYVQPNVAYHTQYAPYLVQERRWVPVVENRVEYRPVVSQFFLNYSHYYVTPSYNYAYPYNGWVGYNY